MKNISDLVLGDSADFIDYRGKTPNKTTFGVPLITAKIVKNGTILEPSEYISKEDYPKWMTRGFPLVGDVVLTTEAPLGEVAQIKDASYALAQRIITIRGHQGVLDNGFLKYFLQSPIGQSRLKERETGTTVTGIKSSELKKVIVSVPEYENQKAIAEILSSLDDKIELNNQINQNLEDLAQAIFKQWFVDFEFPNENGKPYKSSGGEMVESELGEIPKGWKVERLGNHLYIKGRIGWKGLKKSEYLDEFQGYSIINGSDFSNEQIDYSKCGWIPKDRFDDSPEIQLKVHDILITKDGTIGKLAFVNKIENPTSVASGVFVVRPESKSVKTYFLWSFFKSFYFQSLVKSRIDGSVIPHLYQKDFVEMFIPLPPQDLLNEFENQAEGIFNKVFENKEESSIIGKLRDTLLPKLISGELKVNQFEKEVYG